MAIRTITYDNKVALNENPDIADVNKVTDDDMNEIKSVVSNNANNIGDISDLETSVTSSIVGAINSNLIKKIYLTKTSDQSITNDYSKIIWQNSVGDTTYLSNNAGDVTINIDCSFLIMILNISVSNSTQFYYQMQKNGTTVKNGWTSTGWAHPFVVNVIPVQKNDVFSVNGYSATQNNTISSSTATTSMTVIVI